MKNKIIFPIIASVVGLIGFTSVLSSKPTITPVKNVVTPTVIESTPTPEPTQTPAVTDTPAPTAAPLATNTPIPPTVYIAPTNTPAPAQQSSTGGYSCNCAKTCSNMGCEEAYFQLNQCGCSERDGDSDGVPCESVCQ